jgi:hypothetical protein
VYVVSGNLLAAIYVPTNAIVPTQSKLNIEAFLQLKLQYWSVKMHGQKWTSAGTAFIMVGAVASFLCLGVFLVKYFAKSKTQDTDEVVSSI